MESSKIDDDAPEEEEDGQRRRKRPRRVQGKESLDQVGVFQVHPLKIILHVYDDDGYDPKPAKLITLKFEYLVKLNVICVGIEATNDGPENDILCNLFPNDTGFELPHQVWICSLHVIGTLFICLSFELPIYVIIFFLNGDSVSQALHWGCYNVQWS